MSPVTSPRRLSHTASVNSKHISTSDTLSDDYGYDCTDDTCYDFNDDAAADSHVDSRGSGTRHVSAGGIGDRSKHGGVSVGAERVSEVAYRSIGPSSTPPPGTTTSGAVRASSGCGASELSLQQTAAWYAAEEAYFVRADNAPNLYACRSARCLFSFCFHDDSNARQLITRCPLTLPIVAHSMWMVSKHNGWSTDAAARDPSAPATLSWKTNNSWTRGGILVSEADFHPAVVVRYLCMTVMATSPRRTVPAMQPPTLPTHVLLIVSGYEVM